MTWVTGLGETQKDTTETRKGRNALFHENLKNLQDAQRILAKAIDVLTKSRRPCCG